MVFKVNSTEIVRKVVQGISKCMDYLIMVTFFILFIYGCYSLWDSNQIYAQADSEMYSIYKPTEEDDLGYEEIKRINKDTCAWLTVYGTGIDYPVFHTDNNEKYVHTDAKGKYSMAGALFLDFRNSSDLTDFSNIIYGHHMEKGKMFGDLSKFKSRDYFEKHEYGKIYIGDRFYGIHFMAYLNEDAYNTKVYRPVIQGDEEKVTYLNYIWDNAKQTREIDSDITDRYILLSTCSSVETNGRTILVGKITDKVYPDPFFKEDNSEEKSKSIWEILQEKIILILVIILIILILAFLILYFRRKKIIAGRKTTTGKGER